jgi:predicted nucleic acid-binding protein
MNVVDSSGWLEYFSNGPNASFFEKPILARNSKIIIPSISVYEIFKKIYVEQGKDPALKIMASLLAYPIIPLDEKMAVKASLFSVQFKLPMADAIIYSTARSNAATLWTQDEHFDGLEDVKFIRKSPRRKK